jgi:hypothetical protein
LTPALFSDIVICPILSECEGGVIVSTLKDVEDFLHNQRLRMEMFGVEEGVEDDFLCQIAAIGEALTSEMGIPLEDGLKLPGETELTPKANGLFIALKELMKRR